MARVFCDGCGHRIKQPRDGYCPVCGVMVRNSRQVVFAPPSKYAPHTEAEGEAATELREQSTAIWDQALKD